MSVKISKFLSKNLIELKKIQLLNLPKSNRRITSSLAKIGYMLKMLLEVLNVTMLWYKDLETGANYYETKQFSSPLVSGILQRTFPLSKQ